MISAGSGVRGNFSMDSSSIVLVVMINIELHGFKTFAHDIESDSMVNWTVRWDRCAWRASWYDKTRFP